jgi:2-keto-3-deoxy-L-rhamnonate aldolase RhmA
MMIPEPAIASILGDSGVDFVVIDAEHGPYTLSSMRSCVEALKATPASIVVRTASANRVEIQQLLDLGVDGVLVPHIASAEEAASIVRAARYPPEGTRGMGGAVRATRYGLDAAAYFEHANASIVVMALIENARGVQNSAQIAAISGLDGIVVGPGDLSADLGVVGQPDHPKLREAIDSVFACTLAAGLRIGAPSGAPSFAEHESMLVYAFTDATALASAVRAALEHVREAASVRGPGKTGHTILTDPGQKASS